MNYVACIKIHWIEILLGVCWQLGPLPQVPAPKCIGVTHGSSSNKSLHEMQCPPMVNRANKAYAFKSLAKVEQQSPARTNSTPSVVVLEESERP